uniref:Alkyl hydroperoxide reductase subunit C/ Thiol specific antioxidant domain-containing protein n=1 Tax=Rhodosorus marinus TaxID=101924 RepID=A0A7S0BQB2_9RHOD|mmetsp:Transcript_3276/g.4708  ORF Transcript_3276/g.4708 Transcript_3276/m.4708 type:complete len:172 (+) Transcript_3276:171-686(+)|eukprot:CAMPEP_0184742488 /NCGR_PEP_ID=MMETSP0315-20130426/5414_1 /TAXON_ID=101924 /ORGANISM="Rhodosorus marinus, Strain UTEX LB 2760" /LENGTH=171 /DNA_ID=CAMNT_0027213303 /DNA_START=142 /DNA_END=657 /DNA_ORIENTATION=+
MAEPLCFVMPALPNLRGGNTGTEDLLKRGSSVVIAVSGKSTQKFAESWLSQLKEQVPEATYVAVADLSTVPGLLKPAVVKILRSTIPEDPACPLLLDTRGHFKKVYSNTQSTTSLFVVDKQGKLLMHKEATDPSPSELDEVISAIQKSNGFLGPLLENFSSSRSSSSSLKL